MKPENHGYCKKTRSLSKRFHNIFNKIIKENFPNLKKVCPFRYRKPPGHQTDLTKIEPPPQHITIKTTSTENREY
jgi:hypothetical protein